MNMPKFFLPIRRLGRDTSGNVAMLFGLMVVPLLASAGAGIDYSRAAKIRATMQSAVDSAAVAGAIAYTGAATASAAQTLASNYVTQGTSALLSSATFTSPTVTPGTQTTGGVVSGYTMTVTVEATVPTTLMALFRSTMTVHATARASSIGSGNACLLALHPTADYAVDFSGGATFNASNCAVASNSTSAAALRMTGDSRMTASTIYLKGDKTINNNAVLTLSEAEHVNYAPGTIDPYAGLYAQPSLPPSCTATNYVINGSSTATINPGRYCGGIRAVGSATLTMMAGTYYIDSGDFAVALSGKILCGGCTGGNGVTLVLTASNAANIGSLQISGSGTVDLIAPGPSSGQPYPGMVVYQDPRISTGGPSSSISGSGGFQLTGVVYLPNTALSITGTTTAMSSGRACSIIIVRTITQSGSSNGATGDCASYGALIPGGRRVVLVM